MELVLVIENEFRTRRQVCDHLERADFRVLTADDAIVGMNMLSRENPDLLVVDSNTFQHGAVNLAEKIRMEPRLATLPILVILPAGKNKSFSQSLDVYADDYLQKPVRPNILVTHVQALLNWKKGKSGPLKRLVCGELVLDQVAQQLSVRNEPIHLSPAQYQLIAMLMQKPGHIYKRKDLLKAIQKGSDSGDGRKLDTHIRNLRQKIETNPMIPKYIETVVGIGYCLRNQ